MEWRRRQGERLDRLIRGNWKSWRRRKGGKRRGKETEIGKT